MTPIRSCIPESTDKRPRDPYRCGLLGMFLVSLLYERKCLKIDLLKVKCCLNVPFIIWFLYVLNSITFVLRNTRRNDWEGICLFADKQLKFMHSNEPLFMLNFVLFF